MPTYDYVCDACGHEFEAFEPITAQPRTDCPECLETKLRRKIGPGAAILFKGSGFYQTDYRSESYKKAAQAEMSAGEPAKSSGGPANSSGGPAKSSGEPAKSAGEPAKSASESTKSATSPTAPASGPAKAASSSSKNHS
jgi:putative FmdB family regulatory protein